MKLILPLLLLMNQVHAFEIEGTQVLKGSIDTKIVVNNVKTKCAIEVDKVKNSMEEDSYGNPGYTVRASVSLSGEDTKRKIKIKYKKEHQFTNIFKIGEKSEVRDFEYTAGEAKFGIDDDGRIKKVEFTFEGQPILCNF